MEGKRFARMSAPSTRRGTDVQALMHGRVSEVYGEGMGPSMRRTAYPDDDDVQRDYARHDTLKCPDVLGPFARGDDPGRHNAVAEEVPHSARSYRRRMNLQVYRMYRLAAGMGVVRLRGAECLAELVEISPPGVP